MSQEKEIPSGARSGDEDFELVRQAWESARGDIRNALPLLCDDIEIVPFGATLEGRVYRGHEEVVAWWDNEIVPNWEAFETVAEDFRRVGTDAWSS